MLTDALTSDEPLFDIVAIAAIELFARPKFFGTLHTTAFLTGLSARLKKKTF